MNDRCLFCGEGLWPEDNRIYECGSLIGASAPETGLCHTGYEHRLKALVREMAEGLQTVVVARERVVLMGPLAFSLAWQKAHEILSRPEVKEIMERIGPEDMPKSEDMVCPQER